MVLFGYGINVQDLIHKYGEFESFLPEELHKINFEKLKILKEEFVRISSEDLETMRNLVRENSLNLDIEKFKKMDYIIRMAFYLPGDTIQEEHSYFAHWYMSMVTLDILSNAVIDLYPVLINYYDLYVSEKSSINEKKQNFTLFVRTYQDFYGYLINVKQTIYAYHDLFIRTCNHITRLNPIFSLTKCTQL
jgi:hypothetical protein